MLCKYLVTFVIDFILLLNYFLIFSPKCYDLYHKYYALKFSCPGYVKDRLIAWDVDYEKIERKRKIYELPGCNIYLIFWYLKCVFCKSVSTNFETGFPYRNWPKKFFKVFFIFFLLPTGLSLCTQVQFRFVEFWMKICWNLSHK